MRDLVALLVALGLVVAALRLATTLHVWRKRRGELYDAERLRGRTIVAEIPEGGGLTLFSEDAARFHYGDREIEKASITAVRMLVNGSPITAVISTRHRGTAASAASFEERFDPFARDRWDVSIETGGDTVVVECGAVRDGISQELARAVFDAVKRDVERRNATPA